MLGAAIALRGLQIPLSKYSYLTQTGLVALAGSLLVGLPATVAGGRRRHGRDRSRVASQVVARRCGQRRS